MEKERAHALEMAEEEAQAAQAQAEAPRRRAVSRTAAAENFPHSASAVLRWKKSHSPGHGRKSCLQFFQLLQMIAVAWDLHMQKKIQGAI